MSAERPPEWGKFSRRALFTIAVSWGAASTLNVLFGPPKPTREPKGFAPYSLGQTVAPVYSVELPSGVEPLEKGQRQEAERRLREVADILAEYLTEDICTADNREQLRQIQYLDDGAFTLRIREMQTRKFGNEANKEYWHLNIGPEDSHKLQIEYEYQPGGLYVKNTHLRAQLTLRSIPDIEEMAALRETGLEVKENSLETFFHSTLKVPPSIRVDTLKSDNAIVAMGIDQGLRTFRAYAHTSGLIGVIINGPILTPRPIENPFFIPEIVPEGIPGGFPRG